MIDILVSRRKERAYIIPKSEIGVRWLRANIVNANQSKSVSIPIDVLEDFVAELQKDDLNVEVQ